LIQRPQVYTLHFSTLQKP